MCQCQLSLLTLPSEAAMPPCAATVCERVGTTLDTTATFSPACASCSAARIPAPPAPTTTTSKVLFAIAITFPYAVIPAQAGIQMIYSISRSIEQYRRAGHTGAGTKVFRTRHYSSSGAGGDAPPEFFLFVGEKKIIL